jgi:lysine-specific demethylase/histidyl-hydroxylase NO66
LVDHWTKGREKDWRVSRLRANAPVEVEDFVPTALRAVEETREAAMAAIETTCTVQPGDIAYIPRGQFHAATTPRGRSLHVTFAIRPLCGYDLARALARLALFDPEVRRYPPELRGEATGAAESGFVEGLRARLRQLADDPRLEQVLAELRAELVARSRGGRP